MTTIGAFFQKELEGAALPQVLLDGELLSMGVDRRTRTVTLPARFAGLVEYSQLQAFCRLAAGKALRRVIVEPQFPQESFSPDCLPSLAAALKERDASLNGSMRGASARMEGDTLVVSLAHGGFELLKTRDTAGQMQGLIAAWFGIQCPVRFDGKLAVKEGDGSLVEQVHRQEVKRQREAVMRELEEYEEQMADKAARRRVEIREGEFLLPQIVPESARPLLGQVPKAPPVPLSQLSLDLGAAVVWGEIFSIESLFNVSWYR